MAKNEIPVRMCSGCMKRLHKNELLRVACADGEIRVDQTKKEKGRGAYVCPDVNCIEKAKKKNWLARSLKCKIPDEIYEELKNLAVGK